MALRYDDFRLDASSLRELPDGSIVVKGRLTRTGIFSYRNDNGTERKEYRPKEEVFHADALASFAMAPVTVGHPRERLVSAATWKSRSVGHLGETIRQDGDFAEADIYIRDAATVGDVKSGKLVGLSLGYKLSYDPTPGVTPQGERYDGVQRGIRGNHAALLRRDEEPRGGAACSLRLDSAGDEVRDDGLNWLGMTPEQLQAQLEALTAELAKSRTDAAELTTLTARVAALTSELAQARTDAADAVSAERLDALVADLTSTRELAAANGVDVKDAAGKALSTLALKRKVVAKRTSSLASRVDSMGADALDACIAVYRDAPHPSMTAAVAPLATPPVAPVAAPAARTDAAAPAVPKIADLQAASNKRSIEAWHTDVADAVRTTRTVEGAIQFNNRPTGV